MKLTTENFELYAAKYYDDKLNITTIEFQNDLRLFLYIKKLFTRFRHGEELNVRLILNHIIILYNIFGEKATNMLYLKLEGMESLLTPFILILNFLPEKIEYDDKVIYSCNIVMNQYVISELRKIIKRGC